MARRVSFKVRIEIALSQVASGCRRQPNQALFWLSESCSISPGPPDKYYHRKLQIYVVGGEAREGRMWGGVEKPVWLWRPGHANCRMNTIEGQRADRLAASASAFPLYHVILR
jgi:hypothetical protein